MVGVTFGQRGRTGLRVAGPDRGPSGPEPESVAPTAPGGASARMASSRADGLYGSCSRSSSAAASQSALPAARPAPSSIACAAVKAPSSWLMCDGKRVSGLGGDDALRRDDRDRLERQRLGDLGDPPPPGHAGTARQCGAEVVLVTFELRSQGEQLSARSARRPDAAASPRAIAAADEPSPRSSGIRLRKWKRFPAVGASSA